MAEIFLDMAELIFLIARFASFPRWRNLNHFSHVLSVHFTDGAKFEDIAKVIFVFT